MRSSLKQIAAVMALGAVSMGSSALAGFTGQSALCATNADGSGYCAGSFLGFRNHPNPQVFASFTDSHSGYREFAAQYAPDAVTPAQRYGCMPSSALQSFWPEAMKHDGYFYISWDAQGTCNSLHLAHGSQYANY